MLAFKFSFGKNLDTLAMLAVISAAGYSVYQFIGWWTVLAFLAYPVYAYHVMERTWVYYCAGMNVRKVGKEIGLTKIAKFLTFLPALKATLSNFILAWTVAPVLFLDPFPRGAGFSKALIFYTNDSRYKGTWRERLADYFANNLLNPHEFVGVHIPGSKD